MNSRTVDVDVLIKECEQIRKQSFACENQEYWIGVSRTAFPIFNRSNRLIAVVGIAGPTIRIAPAKKENWDK